MWSHCNCVIVGVIQILFWKVTYDAFIVFQAFRMVPENREMKIITVEKLSACKTQRDGNAGLHFSRLLKYIRNPNSRPFQPKAEKAIHKYVSKLNSLIYLLHLTYYHDIYVCQYVRKLV